MNDGGPAFPCDENNEYKAYPGMSLRAYFAGQAMQSLIMHNHKQRFEGAPRIQYSATAYEAVWYSDALIAALEVKHE